ncbi:DEAD/DEAH box helicase [Alteromonas sp. ASW11-36]|uniref:DEAD/DEAH box helicase n=1 Tax=Alteromonas arenosi TaxID=3055817 RepID=A0ABT7SWS9_9ALTE|nr:DEAD/DEAH box helicase [Alteromonas sp. ASW11-36]MDM7860646.1 DEAD/DEAH box helicase [Alteromonas sp. ASW11-36]
MPTFESLGLSAQLVEALAKNNYQTPTPIQHQAIPGVLQGRDIMAAAQTGTGKTAAFILPILHQLQQSPAKVAHNQARVLVITPTRELAAQIYDNTVKYGASLGLNYNVVFGGVKINPQMQKLRRGTDILIATPGRLLDLYQQNAVKFNQLQTLVLDEADRMLDMGFIHDIKRVLALLPEKRQNLLFSATFSEDIRELAQSIVRDPLQLTVTPPNSVVDRIDQCLYQVAKSDKNRLLVNIIKQQKAEQILVFSRTKHGANRLVKILERNGISAAAIHGNKSQGARTRALSEFKDNTINVLVATDIAARGIDISQLPCVINFDLPNVAEDYVHRIGRTGRAGKSGIAISLVCAEEEKQLADIERLIGEHIPREQMSGFSIVDTLPMTNLAKKAKKPKKPKVKKALDSGKPNTHARALGDRAKEEGDKLRPKKKRVKRRNSGMKQH